MFFKKGSEKSMINGATNYADFTDWLLLCAAIICEICVICSLLFYLPLIKDNGNDGRDVGSGNATVAVGIGSRLIDVCSLLV